MILFGHMGITALAFQTYDCAFGRKGGSGANRHTDYRFVLLGAVLPDLMDKPVGMFLLRSTFHNSRIFAHTLLFSLLLLAVGFAIFRTKRKNQILTLGAASLCHIMLDSMWQYPQTLFWPLLSPAFPARPEGNWLGEGLQRLVNDPVYLGSELLGFAVIVFLFARSFYHKQFNNFLKQGRL